MHNKIVGDLMLPLNEYAVVSEDATIRDALLALDAAQKFLPPGQDPHRAVLVTDSRGEIVGKLGHLAFLKALEPKYEALGGVEKLAEAGVSVELINSMMDNYRFWQDDLRILCRRAKSIRVREVMRPIDESIDEKATLTEALHRLIMLQSLSILVKRGDRVMGILRLSELFEEIAGYVKLAECEDD